MAHHALFTDIIIESVLLKMVDSKIIPIIKVNAKSIVTGLDITPSHPWFPTIYEQAQEEGFISKEQEAGI